MATDKTCKYYVTKGRCSHNDAPNPSTSRCLGTDKTKVNHFLPRNVYEPKDQSQLGQARALAYLATIRPNTF
jgi:hypothetical protein